MDLFCCGEYPHRFPHPGPSLYTALVSLLQVSQNILVNSEKCSGIIEKDAVLTIRYLVTVLLVKIKRLYYLYSCQFDQSEEMTLKKAELIRKIEFLTL